MRRVVPDLHEVVVLRAQDAGQRLVDDLERDRSTGRDELPREVGELLRSVRMAAGRGQEPVALPLCLNRSAMKPLNLTGEIIPTSSCFALRQNASFLSWKIRSSRCRLLPR